MPEPATRALLWDRDGVLIDSRAAQLAVGVSTMTGMGRPPVRVL